MFLPGSRGSQGHARARLLATTGWPARIATLSQASQVLRSENDPTLVQTTSPLDPRPYSAGCVRTTWGHTRGLAARVRGTQMIGSLRCGCELEDCFVMGGALPLASQVQSVRHGAE